ncbi:MAG: PxKF domain-containing protein [Thermoleophilaceae bacterium]
MLTLALAPGALAADEVGDAGDLRVTANDMGDSAVTEISGTLLDASDADLYRICLSDGASFSATTVGTTALDTQLFLFDADGYGVYANDDWVTRGSNLPANHRFSPRTGGEYYLAISQYNRDPQSSQGEIFQDTFSRTAFPDGVLFANGFGASETLSSWDGRQAGRQGSYLIRLTGTATCVPPDTTKPTVQITSPVDGSKVQQGADVTVDFACADEGGSGLASCVGSTADGTQLDTSKLGPVTVTVTARDGAGNETVATSTVTVEDRTKPKATLTTPADGAVYDRGQHVAADYACADEPNGSGMDTCVGDVPNGADVDTGTLGEHSFTVTATDHAGNSDSAVAHYTVVDVTAPTISLATPSQGAVYDLGQQVAASYSCADEEGGSGLASCTGTVANGAGVDTSSVGEKSFTVNATDNAGNPASQTVTYRVADRVAPAITVGSPSDGAVYGLGDRVLADYSCADQPGGSGVATCTGTVAKGAPIDTSSFGAHTFEVSATDGAGNSATKTVTYSVVYEFDGFFWPVKNLPGVTRWKAGLPVPVRFSLHGFRGARPEADGYPRSMRCGGGDVEQAARAAQGKKRPAFEYDRRSDKYVMLWRTDRGWAGGCRDFVLKLDDGSVHTARFEFGKKKHDRDR